MRVLAFIIILSISSSCAIFGKSKGDLRQEKVDSYVKKLKGLRGKKLAKKSEWIPFYIPNQDD